MRITDKIFGTHSEREIKRIKDKVYDLKEIMYADEE